MPQLFHPRANTIVRAIIVGVMLGVVGLIWIIYEVTWSPLITKVNVPIEQPIQFSHKHHVGALGIDCRYCHTGVEVTGFAGIPSTQTCMTCHSQVWRDAPILLPVRESFRLNRPIQWNRVNQLPGYVYFNHSVHVNRGVGCVTCHGRVDRMPLMAKAQTFYMSWCLECHRQPENRLRPKNEVFNMDYVPVATDRVSADQTHWLGRGGIATKRLEDCSICHR
jgi:hypothetical protein